MSFRIAQFNILGRHMAGTMWFHYARDFLPKGLAAKSPDWSRDAGFPRCLLWKEGAPDGPGRFYRFPVLLAEIRALNADVLCLVELDCFAEFRDALWQDGYDAVFQMRPGKADGCGIFWRRDVFTAGAPPSSLAYEVPAQDRVALAQPLWHVHAAQPLLVISTHLHWDQEAGHQVEEAQELLTFTKSAAERAGPWYQNCPTVICGDLNAVPDSPAHRLLCGAADAGTVGRFLDAAAPYVAGTFTSLKPDVYYWARPRGRQRDETAQEEWHMQAGRSDVIDYVLVDRETLEVEAPPELPALTLRAPRGVASGGPAAAAAKPQPPFGFWAGGWAFAGSPAEGYEEQKCNPAWVPARAQGELQLGIPNRQRGSDHIPVACTLRFREHSSAPEPAHKCPRRSGPQ